MHITGCLTLCASSRLVLSGRDLKEHRVLIPRDKSSPNQAEPSSPVCDITWAVSASTQGLQLWGHTPQTPSSLAHRAAHTTPSTSSSSTRAAPAIFPKLNPSVSYFSPHNSSQRAVRIPDWFGLKSHGAHPAPPLCRDTPGDGERWDAPCSRATPNLTLGHLLKTFLL